MIEMRGSPARVWAPLPRHADRGHIHVAALAAYREATWLIGWDEASLGENQQRERRMSRRWWRAGHSTLNDVGDSIRKFYAYKDVSSQQTEAAALWGSRLLRLQSG